VTARGDSDEVADRRRFRALRLIMAKSETSENKADQWGIDRVEVQSEPRFVRDELS